MLNTACPSAEPLETPHVTIPVETAKGCMLWAALQKHGRSEFAHMQSREVCARVYYEGGHETGNRDLWHGADLWRKKTTVKMPLSHDPDGKYWCAPSAGQHVLCAVHTEEQSVRTWVGSGRQVVAWHYWKPWLLKEVGVTGFLWWGSRTGNPATHRHCPRWGGNFGGFLSTELEHLILLFSASVLFYIMSPISRQLCRQLWCYVEHHMTSLSIRPHCGERRVRCRSWEAGENLLPLNFRLLILAALCFFSATELEFIVLFFCFISNWTQGFPETPLDSFFKQSQQTAMKKHFLLLWFLTAFLQLPSLAFPSKSHIIIDHKLSVCAQARSPWERSGSLSTGKLFQ